MILDLRIRLSTSVSWGLRIIGTRACWTEWQTGMSCIRLDEILSWISLTSYRAYSGTNAWTATDHTAYTLDTAGWEGFAQILPVYLEHILLPTLSDSGCYTEVHHIDGSGQDAGVVYSEMQGVQNTPETIMNMKAVRKIYPEGIGFRYETGGMMEALRVLTADRIRAFHKEMYQPKNLCLVIIGEVIHEELLKILDEFEASILADIPNPSDPWKRYDEFGYKSLRGNLTNRMWLGHGLSQNLFLQSKNRLSM